MKLIIEPTADGSPTLYRPDLDEHYHSVKGALAESRHVYVDCGWSEVATRRETIRLFEVGFGTGLNCALTAEAALHLRKPTQYYSVELYPLPSEAMDGYALSLPKELRGTFEAVNSAPWCQAVRINPWFELIKINDDLRKLDLPGDIDVVYYDAFAPEKQSEMWEPAIFEKIYESMTPGGVLTTYCAKGIIRRMLRKIGFQCERLAGPPGGKREIIRATKSPLLTV